MHRGVTRLCGLTMHGMRDGCTGCAPSPLNGQAEPPPYPTLNNARRITFEYVMLRDVNDLDEHAHALAAMLSDIPAKINLIPFNPWPGSAFERSTAARIHNFAGILMDAGYPTPVRTPRGEDILAACGQLKSTTEKARRTRPGLDAA